MENKAIIKDTFDLGYIVELDNGKLAELRALNIKDEELAYPSKKEENKLIGKVISVNIIFSRIR
ncbi:MAG: hypothetical protein ACI85I_002294 [Arenicella sp.]|jgi:hypothetical protein